MFLLKQNKTFHLRAMVPSSLVPLVGKKELRFTLKTTDKRLASKKAHMLSGLLDNAFNKLSVQSWEVRFMLMKGLLTKTEVHQIIRRYVNESLDEFEYKLELIGGSEKERASELHGLSFDLGMCGLTMKDQQYHHHMGETLDRLLSEMGMSIDRDSAQYKVLCRELLKADIKLIEANISRLEGKKGADSAAILDELGVDPEPAPKPAQAIPEPSPVPSQGSSKMLGDLIDEYKKSKVNWDEGTERNHAPKFKALLQFLGNRPADQITIEDMRNFARLLEVLPPGFAKLKQYADLTGLKAETLEGKHKRIMDQTTRRDYLIQAKALFAFAVENQYAQFNPVISSIIPPKKKNAREQRDPFTAEDLQRIFDPELFLKWSKDSPARFFIPLMLLYTGCRLEEIASLYCVDVLQHEGLWCIDVNRDQDRKAKNDNAIRTVPLHPILVNNFRFPEYVQNVKHERVFPELTPSNFKYGHEFSKRFGYYLRKKVGIKEETKTLHSFRHAVTDQLFKKLVIESLIEELTGRAGKTETRKRYAKGYRVETLYEECILKLDFEIDLSGLYSGPR